MHNLQTYQRRSSLGQTLLEALITLLVIAFVVIAVIQFQSYLAYDNSLTRENADAVQLAISKLSNLIDYQVLNTTTGYTAYQDIASGTATATTSTTTYNLSWTVTPLTNPTYKTIVMTVSWTDRKGTSQSISLVTKVASMDPAFSAAIM